MVDAVLDRRRSVEVRVKLSPSLAERFSSIAERRGLAPATLAAVALGEYVEAQDQRLQLQRMSVVDVSRRLSDSLSDPEQLVRLMQQFMSDPAAMALLSQAEGEEG